MLLRKCVVTLKLDTLSSICSVCIHRVEMKYDLNGRPYYVDHNTRTTSWIRPTPLPTGLVILFALILR